MLQVYLLEFRVVRLVQQIQAHQVDPATLKTNTQ